MAEQFSLFGEAPKVTAFDPVKLPVPDKRGPARVRFGTSSWTYPGWKGLVYRDLAAYGSRFSQLSLAEYARDPRFRAVGADNLYYVSPAERLPMLRRIREQVAAVPGFELCPKVWHGVTVNRYTAEQQAQFRLTTDINRDFLDPDVFLDQVLLPLRESLGPHLGPLILEIQDNDLEPQAFALTLARFLSGVKARAPLRMAVELRTLAHFTPRYLDTLADHGVAHAYNSWTRMPPIGWQHQRAHTVTQAAGVALVRALLRPGQLEGKRLVQGSRYAEAVEAYEPYDKLVNPLPDVRSDILQVIAQASDDAPVYVLVNNRLEGCAPRTIDDLLASLGAPAPSVPGPAT